MTIILFIYGLFILTLTWAEYNQSNSQYWLKPLCALSFILLAILNGAIYWNFGQYILMGLIFCAIGDSLLLSRGNPKIFKLGMAAFAIGHIIYILAFLRHPGFSFDFIKAILAMLPIITAIIYVYWIKDKLPSEFMVPVAIYSIIIVTMLVLSLAIPIWTIILAASLFAISDIFVAYDRFINRKPSHSLIITPLYFYAQGLFALSANF